MSTDINQLRDLSTLFTRSEILRLLKNDFGSIDKKLTRYDLIDEKRGSTYLKVFKEEYKKLQKNYQNEYVVKNEFLNQNLIKQIGNRHSVIFNEMRLGGATADLAIFNGVSKVFEIKTILDKEYRLSKQLEVYKKIFNEVYVIVPQENVLQYMKYDSNVAIISYDAEIKEFRVEREATKNIDIDIDVLMNVLHSKEYLDITHSYYDELPEINAFNQFEVCKILISKIPYEELNCSFIKTMKNRKVYNSFFNKVNNEFNQVCLSLNLKEDQRKDLINKLKANKVC
ncbi:sce7726 family protein [Psychrobacter glaciei]|uniref:sce7726 family protein n=1 Tax=Psychrobacter glaciei TaxID=619771 RepID=UPI001F067A36|nr:sce7726 family protein [Psychrobacter glaciei]MCH1783135.1 sce7726 family protein [Psychrobacter glaciei]